MFPNRRPVDVATRKKRKIPPRAVTEVTGPRRRICRIKKNRAPGGARLENAGVGAGKPQRGTCCVSGDSGRIYIRRHSVIALCSAHLPPAMPHRECQPCAEDCEKSAQVKKSVSHRVTVAIRDDESMLMCVMHVRHMRMSVTQPRVMMHMRVRLARR